MIQTEKISIALCIFLIVSLTGGCASNYGADTISDHGRYLDLEKNKSTKLEVYELFGQPVDVVSIAEDSMVYWKYIKTRSQVSGVTYVPFVGLLFGGNNETVNTAVFYFDENDTFTKLETFDKGRYQNMWIALGKITAEGNERKDARIRVAVEMKKLGIDFDLKSFNQQYQTDELKGA
jgi:hypothetical protein